MKKTDLAYIAGILDGEGCICISQSSITGKSGRRYFQLGVYVENTNEWLVRWLHLSFGGGLYERKTQINTPIWQWRISSAQASEFLELILPFLKLKKPQTEIAIQFQRKRKPRGQSRTDEELALEEAQRIILNGMNSSSGRNKGKSEIQQVNKYIGVAN